MHIAAHNSQCRAQLWARIAAHNSQCRAQFTMPSTIHNATHNCNQCNFASSWADALRTHLKTHSGEKSNKCNQCDFACSDTSSLWRHLKTHNGEKAHKCNQCDYASSEASNLRAHLKTHNGKNHTNAANVTMQLPMHTIWGHIWRHAVESNKCNQCDYASSFTSALKKH